MTIPLHQPTVAPPDAVVAVLDQLVATNGTPFGIHLSDARRETTDTDWSWGDGETLRATSGELLALLSGRALPDGHALPRVGHGAE